MEKYASHGWMIADTYNSLIQAFGKQFDTFSFRELASFTRSLGTVGLRQSDIISEVINRIQTVAGKQEGGDTEENYSASFNRVILPIF
jgi:hypothetical protein